MNHLPAIQVSRAADGVTTVALSATAMSEENLDATRHELFPLADSLLTGEVQLDFSQVTSLGSSALGLLLTLNRRTTKAGGHLALCGLAPHLQQLLRLIRLDTILDVRRGD